MQMNITRQRNYSFVAFNRHSHYEIGLSKWKHFSFRTARVANSVLEAQQQHQYQQQRKERKKIVNIRWKRGKVVGNSIKIHCLIHTTSWFDSASISCKNERFSVRCVMDCQSIDRLLYERNEKTKKKPDHSNDHFNCVREND